MATATKQDMLHNWATLNHALMNGTEDLARELLKLEQAGEKRITFINRIYSRINRLRATRERGLLHG